MNVIIQLIVVDGFRVVMQMEYHDAVDLREQQDVRSLMELSAKDVVAEIIAVGSMQATRKQSADLLFTRNNPSLNNNKLFTYSPPKILLEFINLANTNQINHFFSLDLKSIKILGNSPPV